jgi:hypothetical protein
LGYIGQAPANKAVKTADIEDSAITAAKIADGTVVAGELASDSVTTAKILNANVTTAKLAADAVDGTKLADDAVNSEHYTDGSIDTAHIADLNVTTAKLAADSVTAAKIGDDVIDSEHYAAGSIDTAHIADDQITLAKMAAGTDGNIISYDASGNPVAIATGSDGQILTSTGAGSPPAFEDAAGGGTWVLLGSSTNTSSVGPVNFNSLMTTTYRNYVLVIGQASTTTDDVDILLRLLDSSNNPLTGVQYTGAWNIEDGGNGTQYSGSYIGNTAFTVSDGIHNSNSTPSSAVLNIYNNTQTDTTDRVNFHGTTMLYSSANHDPQGGYVFGSYSLGVAVHGLRLDVTSGYLSDVDIQLYGIKRS